MPKHILLVDDEPNILLPLEFLMKNAGYQVRIARNGNEALMKLDQYVPNIMLLDVSMPPGQNGFEICEIVRGREDCKDLRIIMLSAESRDIDKEKGMALGADEFVSKPFSTRTLLTCVESLIGAA